MFAIGQWCNMIAILNPKISLQNFTSFFRAIWILLRRSIDAASIFTLATQREKFSCLIRIRWKLRPVLKSPWEHQVPPLSKVLNSLGVASKWKCLSIRLNCGQSIFLYRFFQFIFDQHIGSHHTRVRCERGADLWQRWWTRTNTKTTGFGEQVNFFRRRNNQWLNS